jgi:exopolyphosphatase/guanosine-5'-triphosphate,3'-diphosphate pyrophosphatase
MAAAKTLRNIAAIDAGSNALRLAIAAVGVDRLPRVIASIREPVRLGHDVFTKGSVTEETLERALHAFRRFRALMREHHVESFRAVATSALREARNRDVVCGRILEVTGIELNVIPAEEEARLVYLAVANRVDLKDRRALLVDIGGGSVEIVLVEDGQIVVTDSFRMGAVRLMHELGDARAGTRRFNKLVREYVEATRKRLRKKIGSKKIEVCLATGGNVESLGDLRHQLWRKSNDLIKLDELGKLITKLQGLTVEERVRELDLRPDRADVIVPSAIVLHRMLQWAGTKEAVLPRVGLKDGLLVDLLGRLNQERSQESRAQVLASAKQLGLKYSLDRDHGEAVSRFAVQLFDATRSLHNLTDDHRLLLEVAGQLHEIGNYVDVTGHHKHSYYLLMHSPLLGLTDWQRAIVANIARYHRKSAPSLNHEPYRNLAPKSRLIVTKLAALLRVADALDREHGGKVTKVEIECRPPRLVLRLRGKGDLLLERWAIERKAELFEEVFGWKVSLTD